MEILQISIRGLPVVNATDATDSSAGPSQMLFEDSGQDPAGCDGIEVSQRTSRHVPRNRSDGV
ncbi:hypothetical protein CQ14_25765 [Bradyrhizobium lablabi]|uniref:Uncharacterized protein n=1 Tax=Bradyrhizobium lablabi TaxID=722472 RepID=A0A0R3MZP6_9BRAD|nr:hypothetical protein CQ14_25765 [Bradyrhizobium lablabi]